VKTPGVASAAMAMKAVREVREAAAPRGPLRMCGSTAPLEELRGALLDAPGTDASAVDVFAARRLRPDDVDALRRAAVVVYGAQVVASLDDGTRADLEVVGRAGRPLIAVLEGVDLPDEPLLEAARVPGVHPMSVLPSKRGRFPLRKAMRLLAERAGAAGPGLAARLPAFRPYVVDRLIETASRRNGFVGTAVWIPGADLPVLTAVQLRLVLQIGVCYDVELSPDRAVELVGVLGAGFGFRTVARELLDLVPVAGWVVKGGVSYGGTRALGRAADEYFARGAPADLTKVREAAERLRRETVG
jgi:uncharacterized protein (DUF697 family)